MTIQVNNQEIQVAGIKSTNVKEVAPQADGTGYAREVQFFQSADSGARPVLTVRIHGDAQADLQITVPEHEF